MAKHDDRQKSRHIHIEYNSDIGTVLPTAASVAEFLGRRAKVCSDNGNYGVAAVLIDKRIDPKTGEPCRKIVSVGMNTTARKFEYDGVKYHEVHTDGHAEMNIIRDFYKRKELAMQDVKKGHRSLASVDDEFNPDNYELWSSLECCRMCEGAVRKAGFKTYYIATDDIVAGTDKVYASDPKTSQAIQDANRAIRNEHNHLIRMADGVLEGAYAQEIFDNEKYRDAAKQAFESTKKAVRDAKDAKEAVQSEHQLDVAKLLTSPWKEERIRGEKICKVIRSVVKDFDEVFTPHAAANDSRVMEMVVQRAHRSRANGNAFDGVAAIDPYGNVWFTVGDHTGEQFNPNRTPLMRAMRRVEQILDRMPKDIKPHMPKPSSFTYVSFREPDMGHAGRLANVYSPKTTFLQPDLHHGVVTLGQLPRMGHFYNVIRKLDETKIVQAPIKARDLQAFIDAPIPRKSTDYVRNGHSNGRSGR